MPVVAISHHQASSARRTPIAAIIHHGVDTTAHPIGEGRGGYALFLGRMTPEKGVHIAARVAHAAGIPLKIAAKRREPAEHSYFDHAVAPLLAYGSVPEIVDDGITGFIRSTEADLVDAVHRFDEIDRTQCRNAAEERFTAHRMAADHLALYHRVIGRPLQLPQGRGRARLPELHIVRS